MNDTNVVLVALYRYQNSAIRIMHSLLENIDGIKPYTIFYKEYKATDKFSYPTDQEEKLFVETIEKLNPKLVGFSVLSPYVPIAKRLTELIKKSSVKPIIIWGGLHPTLFPESCIDYADILCRGEGEEAIAELAASLRDNKPYSEIRNLWIKKADNTAKNPMRPLIQDLDNLPFPSYGNKSFYFINENKLSSSDPAIAENALWVKASRGCPYVCSYCVNSLLHSSFKGLGPYMRRRSVQNILKEIKSALSIPKNKKDYIFFVDEVFGEDEDWLNEFETSYKEEIGIPFFVSYNPKDINAKNFSKLKNAGLETLNFGIQAGTDYIRNRIFHRPGTNKEILEVAKMVSGKGIRVLYDLILDNPYDTEETLKETIGLFLGLPKPLSFNLFSLQYFPNYPLTKKAIEDKFISPDEISLDNLFKSATRNMAFVPKLSFNRKQILQNIIWLVVWNHAKDSSVKYAVFKDSPGAKLVLGYLNLKSVILGALYGAGGFAERNLWFLNLTNALSLLFKGDLKTIHSKIKRRIKRLKS